jgi:peptidoglycan/LPS O-acetylase OafA/YrhL
MDASNTVNISHARDPILDAWRGVSVVLVIMHHAVIFRFQVLSAEPTDDGFIKPHGIWQLRDLVHDVFGEYTGTLGVQFFFVISGYIITKLLMQEFHRNGRLSLAAFFVRRAFRILPPLWLMLGTVLLLVKLGFVYVSADGFLSAMLFMTNYFPASEWPIRHTWSLGVEEQFYVVWPLLLLLLRFRGIATLALVLSTLLALLAGMPRSSAFDNPMSFACIAIGCCYSANYRFKALLHRAAMWPAVLAAWILVFGRPFLGHVFPGQSTIQNIVQAPLICFVIFSSFRYRTWLEHSSVIRFLAAIGTVSYGLYLWQQIFLAPPAVYLIPVRWETVMIFPLIAWMSYVFLERPLIKVGAQLSRKLVENGKAIPRVTPSGQSES